MTLRIHYYNREPNFGDTANYDLCKKLSGKEPLWVNSAPAYLTMGSIINHPCFQTEVWGSGLLAPDRLLRYRPKKIYAVRGPRTRDWLLRQGVECPEVYGDPGILLPMVFDAAPEKIYDLGIVPHYVDYRYNKALRGMPSNVLVIDIRQAPTKVVEGITSCRHIVSSALHGLITADAYGIPSMWVEFSDKVIGKGFKFHDYFDAVGGDPRVYMDLRRGRELVVDELIRGCRLHPVEHLVESLLGACPFRS